MLDRNTAILIIALQVVVLSCIPSCSKSPKITPVARGAVNGAITLDQNWSPDLRNTMSQLSFGSRLLPYEWFIHLELADSQQLFLSDAHIESLGFIPQQVSPNNPDALPLGFAPDHTNQGTWLGLTCTACHTGIVHYQGARLLIDGAPGMFNFTAFESSLRDALQALLNNPAKLARFAQNLKTENNDALRASITERYNFLKNRIAINHSEVPYGYGRLDAFGQIFNAVSVEALQQPDNARSANAPVSVPVLWDASHLDVVQWNASAPNKEPGPLGQNVTTALAVYGTIDLFSKPLLGYRNSVKISNLGELQKNFYLLTAPRWPEDIFGKIDREKATAGEKLYQQHCQSCHSVVDSSDPLRKLKATPVAVETIGTDPVMAENFANAKSKTATLQGKKLLAGIAGEKMPAEISTFDLVVHAASGAMANKPWATLKSILTEKQDQYNFTPQTGATNYKARPLNGLWASAPYLHNGSVPTIYDILQPANQRPMQFNVGALDFDPIKFGIRQQEKPFTSLFNTRLYGNSNRGHEHGVGLSEQKKWQLIEYLKTL